MLVALFSGDVVCLNGGADAYLADESSAILYVAGTNEETIETLRRGIRSKRKLLHRRFEK